MVTDSDPTMQGCSINSIGETWRVDLIVSWWRMSRTKKAQTSEKVA